MLANYFCLNLDFEEFARHSGAGFASRFGNAECLTDDVAEVLVNPVSEHQMESHVRFQDSRIAFFEAGRRFIPIDSDRIAHRDSFSKPCLFSFDLNATATSPHVAPGLTTARAASKLATSPS